MAEQEFLNYARDDGGNVSVPRRLRTRRNAPEVELAYITPEEAGILSALKPGTPHRGPMEIPNYDSFDAAGNYTSGAAMSAAETGSRDPRDRAEVRASNIGGPKGLGPGATSNQAQALRNSFLNARAMGQRSGFNPINLLGGFFGNIGRGVSGIMGLGKDWAGKMRGGINPKTGEYYTQDEYEQNRANRIANKRIQYILGRKAPITEMTQKNLKKLYEQAGIEGGFIPDEGSTGTSRAIAKDHTMDDTLKEYAFPTSRIQNIQKQKGWDNERAVYDDYNFPDQSGFISEAEYNAQPKFNFNEGPEVLPVGTQFTGNLEDYQRGLVRNVADYNTPKMFEDVGAESGWIGGNKTADAMQKYYDQAMTYFNPEIGQFTGKKGATTPGDVRNQIDVGSSLYGIDMDQIPENFLETIEDYKKQKSPYEVIGIATGGRVGYNTGGRVGILAAF